MKLRIGVLHVGFALTGIVTTLLGPILPILSAQWHLNDAQAGRLFTAQFVSAVAGSLVASRVFARWGAAWTVSTGMLMIAAGVSMTAGGGAPIGYAGIGLFGVGLGFAIPATNLLVAELAPEKRVGALNILNFSWTFGAVTAPLFIAYSEQEIGWRPFLRVLATACGLIALLEFGVLPRVDRQQNRLDRGNLPQASRMVFAVLTCLFLILYVGVENGFSGWLAVLASRTIHAPLATTALIQSSFWAALLAGRLAAPLVVPWLRPRTIVFMGLAGAGIGIAATVLSRNTTEMEAAVLICGLGMAALFPTVVAIFSEWFGTGGAGTIVLGVCGLGGAIVPLAVGTAASCSGSLRIGLLVNLGCLLAAFVAFWRMQALIRAQPNDSDAA